MLCYLCSVTFTCTTEHELGQTECSMFVVSYLYPRFYLQLDGRSKNVLVRQSSTHLHPSCDRNDCTNTELSRMITNEGTVIRHFRDGSSEVIQLMQTRINVI